MREGQSLGGNLNAAVRIGDTVRRRAGPWTPAVHTLLRYLEGASFEAPRARGLDEQGREILTYLEGAWRCECLVPGVRAIDLGEKQASSAGGDDSTPHHRRFALRSPPRRVDPR